MLDYGHSSQRNTLGGGGMKSSNRFFADSGPDDLSSHRHRQLIGYIGLTMPFLLYVIAGWRHVEGLSRWKFLSSISAYYYTGAVAVFAGILVALALFLFSYRGYDNTDRRLDRMAAIAAGIAAIGVAFFPTRAPENLPALSWWTPIIGVIHFVSALILFGSFIFFSLFLFRKSNEKERGSRPLEKRLRNIIFVICGLAMAACIVWVLIALVFRGPIFWPEALALEFFAISWLAKGRAEITLVAGGRRVIYYGSHPWRLILLGKHSAD
jgi:hypothetical protein